MKLPNLVNRRVQVLVHGFFVNPERTSHANSRQITSVYKAVDRHFRDAHHLRNLGDGQKRSFVFMCHMYLTLQLVVRCRLPLPQDFTRTCSN